MIISSLKLPDRVLSFDRVPVFMGIVNVTPDSFSDGGRYWEPRQAVERALQLVVSGAGIIDIGGESTRPGSEGVSEAEELRRVIPVLRAIREAVPPEIVLSIDTTKAAVAEEAIRAGVEIVNDVFSAEDPGMIPLLRRTKAAVCIMHRRGNPKTMQEDPRYVDVLEEVFAFLRDRREQLIASGVEADRILIDPGLGFGKTTRHNWTLVEQVERFHEIGSPLLVGHSRKRFIAETFEDREEGTRIVTQKLAEKGVQIIRVHDIPR